MSPWQSYVQLNIKPGKQSKKGNVRRKTSDWTLKRIWTAWQANHSDCSREVWKILRPSTQRKWWQHSPTTVSHTLLFPSLFATQSEGPIPGPADEAGTTSCQVSPFIVRKHPCKGTYPIVIAQVKEQQIRVENNFSQVCFLTIIFHFPPFLQHPWSLVKGQNTVLTVSIVQCC